MYAVLKNDLRPVRWVELAGSHNVLRSHSHSCPVEILALPESQTTHDDLIGSICQFIVEA